MVYVTRETGRTIFFSSHLISDVERVADRMAILDGGELKVQCSVETFRSRVRQFVLRYPGSPPEPPGIPGILQAVRGRSETRLIVANATDGIVAGLQGLGASSVEEVPLGFEDACIGYLGARGERSFFLSNLGASSREEEET
jgi:ABC-2 type transport system ATP-binding protein